MGTLLTDRILGVAFSLCGGIKGARFVRIALVLSVIIHENCPQRFNRLPLILSNPLKPIPTHTPRLDVHAVWLVGDVAAD